MTPRERHFPRDAPGLPWGATLTPTAPSAPRSPATLRGPWPERAEPGSPPRCGHPPLGRIARLAHWTSRGWEQHAAAAGTEEPGRPGRVTCAHSGVSFAAREAAFIHCAPTFPRRAPLCNTHVPTAAPTASAWPPDPATPAQALPRLGGRGLVSQCPAQAAADLWSPSFSSRPVSWGPLPTGTVVSKSPSDPGHQTGADPDISASNGQWTQCWLPSSTSRTVATRTGLAAFPGGMGPAP